MRYHNITKDDMKNGYGLRCVLWLSGCNHKCKGCHNELTWDCHSGVPFDIEAKNEVFHELEKSYIQGVTLSGGDPLFSANLEEVKVLMEEIKEKFPKKDIWVYTGYTWEEISDWDIVKLIDVLVDGRYVEELKNTQLHWRGSANQRIIDVQKSLCGAVVLLEQ